jgi:hypothetical protein
VRINVTVNTKDSDGITEIRGYRVWWVSNAFDDDATSAHRFPRLSTATTDRLNVGIYSMWIEKAGRPGVHQKIDIGDIYDPGRPDQTVDLTVL